MHLVVYAPQRDLKPFYRIKGHFARPYSLLYLFRKLRQNHNLTIRTLADKFGVTQDYVSKIEGGSEFPSLNFCLKCATEFDINPKYVTNKWAREAIERFSDRLNRRLGLEE
jgi:transcriptional regulator with XRE-family HTH domain